MSKVITFSRRFPAYHPKAGQPTYFVEKIIEWYFDMIPHNFHNIPEMIYQLNPNIPKEILDAFLDDLIGAVRDWKGHTVRGGNRFKAGDKFSPRVWGNDINPKSGRSGPYHSKQIIFLPDIEVKKTWNFEIKQSELSCVDTDLFVDGRRINADLPPRLTEIANNDGLDVLDFLRWFQYPNFFSGQIICWNETINY